MFFSRSRRSVMRNAVSRIPDGRRVYAIGDIHGRFDLLRILMDRIEQHDAAGLPVPVRSDVVFLGDYIDRGTQSREVIEFIFAGQEAHGWTCLMGNHEAMLLAALDGQMDWDVWLSNGGVETLFSYGLSARDFTAGGRLDELAAAVMEVVPPRHLAFLRGLSLQAELGDYFFCHAGVRPGVALDAQSPDDLMWIRDLFLDSRADHGRRIVHGHTPQMEPEILPNRINVDTGAYLTNRLSCVVLEGDQVQVIHT